MQHPETIKNGLYLAAGYVAEQGLYYPSNRKMAEDNTL